VVVPAAVDAEVVVEARVLMVPMMTDVSIVARRATCPVSARNLLATLLVAAAVAAIRVVVVVAATVTAVVAVAALIAQAARLHPKFPCLLEIPTQPSQRLKINVSHAPLRHSAPYGLKTTNSFVGQVTALWARSSLYPLTTSE